MKSQDERARILEIPKSQVYRKPVGFQYPDNGRAEIPETDPVEILETDPPLDEPGPGSW